MKPLSPDTTSEAQRKQYLREWSERLGVLDLLERALDEVQSHGL